MKFTDNPKYKSNIILKRTFEFAVDIVNFSERLGTKRKYTISNQILRSGTSIGANIKSLKMLKVEKILFIN